MKLSIYVLCTILLISFFGCNENEIKPEKQKISGLWKLNSMKVRDTSSGIWSNYKGGMDGYLLYDDTGHVALHLYVKGYEKYENKFPNFNDSIASEDLRHLTNSYYYMGNYTVLDSVVSHYKLSHSNPSEFGLTAERKFYFKGDTLVMQPVEDKNANLKLKWLRNR